MALGLLFSPSEVEGGFTLTRLTMILSCIAVLATACGPGPNSNHGGRRAPKGGTGAFDSDGVAFVTSQNSRNFMQNTKRFQDNKKVNPPANPVEAPFHQRLKEFELTRYDSKAQFDLGAKSLTDKDGKRKGDYKLQGKYGFIWEVFFIDGQGDRLAFTGKFTQLAGDKLTFCQVSTDGKYLVDGFIVDSQDKSIGDFNIYTYQKGDEKDCGQAAESRKSRWLMVLEYSTDKVYTRVTPAQGAQVTDNLKRQFEAINKYSYGVRHNWGVSDGTSVYLMDTVLKADAPADLAKIPTFRYKGKRKQTADEYETYEEPAEAALNSDSQTGSKYAAPKAKMIGTKDGRDAFEMSFADPQDTSKTVDTTVEWSPNPTFFEDESIYVSSAGVPVEDQDASSADTQGSNTGSGSGSGSDAQSGSNPAKTNLQAGNSNGDGSSRTSPTTDNQPEVSAKKELDPVEVYANNSDSYLKIDLKTIGPRSARMIRDFNRNRSLSGVTKWIEYWSTGAGRARMGKFLKYANHFRQAFEAVGLIYDTSPGYAYLTVVESAYFYGGNYAIQSASSSGAWKAAYGPFQFLASTAGNRVVKMKTSGPDERAYFIPSACGAAKMMVDMVDNGFGRSDATLAILGYGYGDAGASMIAYCTEQRNPQRCMSYINRPDADKKNPNIKNKPANWDSEVRKAGSFVRKHNWTFRKLSDYNRVPELMTRYANRKLGAYFVAQEYTKYGFERQGASDLSKLTDAKGRATILPPSRSTYDRSCIDGIKRLGVALP